MFREAIPVKISYDFWEGVYSKRKEFAPLGSFYFHFQ